MRSLALALTLSCVVAVPASSQYATDFIGTYDLVRVEALNDSGDWVHSATTFGGNPTGVIMYDGTTMGVHIIRSDRGEQGGATTQNGYFAYYGRYTVDDQRGIVTHHLENHVNAAQIGVDNVRGFDFDGDLLTLTVEPQRSLRLIWRRRR